MIATTVTLRLEPRPPDAPTEDELDALTRAPARQLDAPALVDFLKVWVTRESRVTIKVQRGADPIEVAFDPRTMNEAQVEIMTGRLLKLMGG